MQGTTCHILSNSICECSNRVLKCPRARVKLIDKFHGADGLAKVSYEVSAASKYKIMTPAKESGARRNRIILLPAGNEVTIVMPTFFGQ